MRKFYLLFVFTFLSLTGFSDSIEDAGNLAHAEYLMAPAADYDLTENIEELKGEFSETVSHSSALQGAPAVVFRVNMSNVSVAPTGVFVSGSFNNWSTSANPMFNIGGGIYEAIVAMDPQTNFTYKFVNGSTYEVINGNCTVNDGNGNFNRAGISTSGLLELPVVCFGSCTNCAGSAVLATFRVDLSQETISPEGVFIAGNFNGFNTTANEMTATLPGIYETTIGVTPNSQITYKFLNGSTYELVNGNCTQNDGGGNFNRFVNAGSTNFTQPLVCFGSCSACVTETYSLTFSVNMNEQTVSPQGVFLSGSFNNWSTTANPMTNNGFGIYSTTLEFEAGQAITYKFVNGTEYELVAGSCTVDGGSGIFNRAYTTTSQNTTLPVVCWGSCNNCPNIDVTFQVNMSQQTVSPQGVYVAGTFNNWSLTANPMTTTGNGIYTATIGLPPGSAISYKFVNGTEYELLQGPCTILGGETVYDRADTLGGTDVVFPLVCWGSCNNCPNIDVTFQVNMNLQTVSPQGVYVAGTFNNWSLTANPMTTAGNGIYTATISLPPGSAISYKFVNGTEYELLQGPCTILGGETVYDRADTLGGFDEVFPLVCWGSCDNCPNPTFTFRVDMSQQTVDPAGVFIAGSFNNWSTNTDELTSVGNGIYSITLEMEAGSPISYKFLNGSEYELLQGPCTILGGQSVFDRADTVGYVSEVLPIVCWGSCSACTTQVNTVDVTFTVNMLPVGAEPEGVFLAGNFNGYSTTATPLTSSDNTVFTVTVAIPENTLTMYKFVNGSFFEEIIGNCTMNDGSGNFNRFFTTGSADLNLETVCFADCDNCGPVGVSATAMDIFTVFPNPTTGDLQVMSGQGGILRVLGVTGQVVQEMQLPSGMNSVQLGNLAQGLYWIQLVGDSGVKTQRIVKQ